MDSVQEMSISKNNVFSDRWFDSAKWFLNPDMWRSVIVVWTRGDGKTRKVNLRGVVKFASFFTWLDYDKCNFQSCKKDEQTAQEHLAEQVGDERQGELIERKRKRAVTRFPLMPKKGKSVHVSLLPDKRPDVKLRRACELKLYELENHTPGILENLSSDGRETRGVRLTENEAQGLLYQVLMDYWEDELEAVGLRYNESALIDEILSVKLHPVFFAGRQARRNNYFPEQVIFTLLREDWEAMFIGLRPEEKAPLIKRMRENISEKLKKERLEFLKLYRLDPSEDWLFECINTALGHQRAGARFAPRKTEEQKIRIARLLVEIMNNESIGSNRVRYQQVISEGATQAFWDKKLSTSTIRSWWREDRHTIERYSKLSLPGEL